MDVVSISSVASIVGVVGVGFSVLKEKIKLGQKIRDYFNKTTEGDGK